MFLGYPIANDEIYNDNVWGPNKGKNAEYGKSHEQVNDQLRAIKTLLTVYW
jgi:hypothetical protein